MSFKNITSSQHDAFLASLRAGQYNLLLGAGASMDSSNHLGFMPSGSQFKEEICHLKKVSEQYSLQRVYSLLTPDEIDEHVTKRFSNANPGPSAKLISSFVWRRIFSWNVDDVMESAYRLKGARQELKPIHYSDEFEDIDTLATLQFIHLHGSAIWPNKGYVFSRTEYINTIKNISHWMVVLSQLMTTEPVVITGTSLDEVDLDYYLSHRTSASSRNDRGPSIFVDKTDDAVVKDLCDRHNLIHFSGYTVDFLRFCERALPHRPTPYELVPLETRKFLPEGISAIAAIAFQTDFELVPSTGRKNFQPSRFHYGVAPSWDDLASNLDISRSAVGEAIAEVENQRDRVKVLLITDGIGTGKTTLLKRVAFELAARGNRVLLCSSLGRLSKATASILDLIDEPLVIVVDNFADHVSSVGDLLNQLEKDDILILGAERTYRFKHIRRIMPAWANDPKNDRLRFTKIEAERLISLYLKLGLIGDHRAIKQQSKFVEKIEADPIAVACCRIMANFEPLGKIIDSLIREASPDDLRAYVITGIAHSCFTAGVRYEILYSASKSTGIKAQFDRNHLVPLTFSDSNRRFVIPENSSIAERVIEAVGATNRQLLLDCFVSLANAIAPRVNRDMIKRRSPEARMVGRLFDYDNVISRLLQEEAREFYRRTEAAWRWNSRYWEQVALLNLAMHHNAEGNIKREHLESAVQHARHAVAIERHPFPLSTLGKVLMTLALSTNPPQSSIYEDALLKLKDAIELEASWSRIAPQPYAIVFSFTVKYIQAGGGMTDEQRNKVGDMMRQAESRFERDHEIHSLLSELRRMLTNARS